jgi:hypothetical protein
VHRLRQIFEPVRSEADHQQELLDDEETAWFGYGRDSTGHPVFQDYGRFAAVMGESHAREVAMERYPQLVTFIGETGQHTPYRNVRLKLTLGRCWEKLACQNAY